MKIRYPMISHFFWATPKANRPNNYPVCVPTRLSIYVPIRLVRTKFWITILLKQKDKKVGWYDNGLIQCCPHGPHRASSDWNTWFFFAFISETSLAMYACLKLFPLNLYTGLLNNSNLALWTIHVSIKRFHKGRP